MASDTITAADLAKYDKHWVTMNGGHVLVDGKPTTSTKRNKPALKQDRAKPVNTRTDGVDQGGRGEEPAVGRFQDSTIDRIKQHESEATEREQQAKAKQRERESHPHDLSQLGANMRDALKHNDIIPRNMAAKMRPNDTLFRPIQDHERFAAALAEVFSDHYAAKKPRNSPGQMSLFDTPMGGRQLRSTATQTRWVTIKGSHVLIDGKGTIVGGAGGKLNGKSVKSKRKRNASSPYKSGDRQAFGPDGLPSNKKAPEGEPGIADKPLTNDKAKPGDQPGLIDGEGKRKAATKLGNESTGKGKQGMLLGGLESSPGQMDFFGGDGTPDDLVMGGEAERINDFGDKIGGARKDLASKTGPRSRMTQQDERPIWRKRYEISQIASSTNESEKGKWAIHDKRKKDWYGNDKQVGPLHESKADAEQALPLLEVARQHRVGPVSESDPQNPEWEIYRRISDYKRPQVKGGFKSQEEAMKFMANNPQEIIETKLKIDDSIHPALEKAVRTGKNYRDGKKATAKSFQDEFGFRGVEFGNWNNNAERQHILNQAHDAFHDLADTLGIPAKAVSLHGELALGFGSRGHGLSGARAHYERNYGAINLTKIKGAGSLGHEWFHALDHYLGRKAGKASDEITTNRRGDQVLKTSGREDDYVSHGHGRKQKEGYRAELKEAFDEVMDAVAAKESEVEINLERKDKFHSERVKQQHDHLDAFRRSLAKDYSDERYKPYRGKKSNLPLPDDKLKEVDSLISKIKSGDIGEMVDLPTKSRSWGLAPSVGTNIARLAEIYKEHRGRNGYRKDQSGRWGGDIMRMQSHHGIVTNSQAELDRLNENNVVKTKVRTDFHNFAKKMDLGTVGDYWSTRHELAARAFEGYLYDKIKANGGRNDFLAYEKHNDLPEYKMFNAKPYPEGAERKRINAAFDKLFKTIKTSDSRQNRLGRDGIEIYGAYLRKQQTHDSILEYYSSGGEDRWITIGADKSKPKGQQGGTPVKISGNGFIKQGPNELEGEKLSDLGDDKNKNQPNQQSKTSTHQPVKRSELRTAAYTATNEIERNIRANKDIEVLASIDANGKVLFQQEGGKDYVIITDEMRPKLKGAIVTHNHPSGWDYGEDDPRRGGNSFSKEDMMVAVVLGVAEMRVVSPGYTFILDTKFDGTNLPTDAERARIEGVIDTANQQARSKFWAEINAHPEGSEAQTRARMLAEANHWHETVSLVSTQLGWHYERIATDDNPQRSEYSARLRSSQARHARIVEFYSAGRTSSQRRSNASKPETANDRKIVTGNEGDRGYFVTIGDHPVFIETKSGNVARGPHSLKGKHVKTVPGTRLHRSKRIKSDRSGDRDSPGQIGAFGNGNGGNLLRSTDTQPKLPANRFLPKTKLDKAIVDAIGNDPDDVAHFRDLVNDSHKMLTSEAREQNDSLLRLLGDYGHGRSMIGARAKLRKWSNLQNVEDIPRLDEMAQTAALEYPHLLESGKGQSDKSGDDEDALFNRLKRGFDRVPEKDDESVIALAKQMFESKGKPSDFDDDFDDQGFADAWGLQNMETKSAQDVVPFSVAFTDSFMESYRAVSGPAKFIEKGYLTLTKNRVQFVSENDTETRSRFQDAYDDLERGYFFGRIEDDRKDQSEHRTARQKPTKVSQSNHPRIGSERKPFRTM